MAAPQAGDLATATSSFERLFDDPDTRFQFQVACAAAQSALVSYLYRKNCFEVLQQRYSQEGMAGSRESKTLMQAAWDDYLAASARYTVATQKLKEVIKEVIVREPDIPRTEP